MKTFAIVQQLNGKPNVNIAAEAIGGAGNRPTWDDVVVKAVV